MSELPTLKNADLETRRALRLAIPVSAPVTVALPVKKAPVVDNTPETAPVEKVPEVEKVPVEKVPEVEKTVEKKHGKKR